MSADTLVETRDSLHVVAELVLAGHEHRVTGRIRLSVSPGGFSTLPLPGEPRRVAVRGTALVVAGADGERTAPLAGTVGDLAGSVGLQALAPQGLYHDGTGADASYVLAVDAAAAEQLTRALGVGDEALRSLGRMLRPDEPPEPVLWPEHFDVGITVDEVNLGVSPGDGYLAEPYAYVGPHTPRTGEFWNAPFGAARPMAELPDVAAVLGWLDAGWRLATA